MNSIEVFGQPFVDWAEEMRRVANELQLNVQAESDAIRNYNNLKVCVQNSALEAELKAEMLEEIDEIVAEELKHQNQLQELYSELTGIVAEEDGEYTEGEWVAVKQQRKVWRQQIAQLEAQLNNS